MALVTGHVVKSEGMAFLGNIAAAVLYGITSIQTSTYSRQNGQDKIVMKSLVFFLWVLDGLHLALITHTLYTRTINDFGNPMALATPTWSITVSLYDHMPVGRQSFLFAGSCSSSCFGRRDCQRPVLSACVEIEWQELAPHGLYCSKLSLILCRFVGLHNQG
ncbi:hypothetical protein AcW1_004274, partial [Taiwanofungus camphoratus]